MTHKEYLHQVEMRLESRSREELREWILERARTIPECGRNEFLKSFDQKKAKGRADEFEEKFDMKAFINWCDKVEEQEICLVCQGYEDYSQGYWSDDWAYEYKDPEGIAEKLKVYFRQADYYFQEESWDNAAELYGRLLNLCIWAKDQDMGDDQELGIKEMKSQGLLELDLTRKYLNYACALYCCEKGSRRARALYEVEGQMSGEMLFLDSLLTNSPFKLENFDAFVEEWKEFLLECRGRHAADLLTEACLYAGGAADLVKWAEKYGKKHPLLLKNACAELLREKNCQECERLAQLAMHQLDEELTIRCEIANLGLGASENLQNEHLTAFWYEQAFASKSDIANFLRLFRLSDGMDRALKAYKRCLRKNHASAATVFVDRDNEFRINSIDKELKLIMGFFAGEWEQVHESCAADRNYLGWSYSFKGKGIALFLTALHQGRIEGKGCQSQIDLLTSEVYGNPLDNVSFQEALDIWKTKMSFSQAECEKYTAWLEKEIDKRADAVVGGGHRKSYFKAARLIAALGELMESRGERGAKSRLMDYYMMKHSRKTAFKADMRALK